MDKVKGPSNDGMLIIISLEFYEHEDVESKNRFDCERLILAIFMSPVDSSFFAILG